MPRKATFKIRNTSVDAPFTAKMAESYFGTIKNDSDGLKEEINDLRKYVDKRFDEANIILKSTFNIIHTYDVERKEMKSTLWEYDRRLIKLEA